MADKYLYGITPDGAETPVIPAHPHMFTYGWTGLDGSRFSQAVVADRNLNLDEALERLSGTFPRLPSSLHGNYLIETARLAAGLPAGTRLFAKVSQDRAEAVTETGRTIVLWNRQPL